MSTITFAEQELFRPYYTATAGYNVKAYLAEYGAALERATSEFAEIINTHIEFMEQKNQKFGYDYAPVERITAS